MQANLKFIILVLTALLSSGAYGAPDKATVGPLSGEQAITFEANSGATTAAYQGSLQVSENRNNPESRLIRLRYVRFPATGESAGPPMFTWPAVQAARG